MQDVITVDNLVVVYSDGTRAVDDVSFRVKEGEFFGFLVRMGRERAPRSRR